MVLQAPQVRTDSLVETEEGLGSNARRAVAVADITGVATRRVNVARTVILALLGAAVVGVIVAAATWDGPLGGCCQ